MQVVSYELVYAMNSGWAVNALLADGNKQMMVYGQPTMEDALRQAAHGWGLGSISLPFKPG